MVLLMPGMRFETGKHDGRRGTWVFSPGSDSLDSLKKYKVDDPNRLRDDRRRKIEHYPERSRDRSHSPGNEPSHSRRQIEHHSPRDGSRRRPDQLLSGDNRRRPDRQDKPKPRDREVLFRPQWDHLAETGRRVDRQYQAIRRKEQDLQGDKAQFADFCLDLEDKIKDLRRRATKERPAERRPYARDGKKSDERHKNDRKN